MVPGAQDEGECGILFKVQNFTQFPPLQLVKFGPGGQEM